MKSATIQKNMVIFCFLLIPIGLMLMFVVYPAIDMLMISFTDWNGSTSTRNYLGLANYIEALTMKPEVWFALRNNVTYVLIGLLFIPIEIVFAVILNMNLKGNKGFKTLFFLPYIINGVAISYIFSFFYSPVNGGLNGILEVLGLGWLIQNWLSDVSVVNYSLALVYVWRNFGFFVVLFIAGLNTIGSDVLEAATIDGANALQKFRFIIIPGIKRVIEIVIFMNMAWCLQMFDIPFIMTSGGPGYASSTFSTYAIETAFRYNNFGLANAMSILLIIIIAFMLLMKKAFTVKE